MTNSKDLNLKSENLGDFNIKRIDNSNSLVEISIHDISDSSYLIMEYLINDYIYKYFLNKTLSSPYIITSERTGIELFEKELNINKNRLFDKFVKDDIEDYNFIKEDYNNYMKPIRDSINNHSRRDSIIKNSSFISDEFNQIIRKFENVLGVNIEFKNGKHFFSYKKDDENYLLPIYLGSSSSKALIDLIIYIKHRATKGGILIIDEPEINLHPKLQIAVARLFASLSNLGVKIIMTTHSDYIVKEINNLIMLNALKEKNISFIEKSGYNTYEPLKEIDFYIAENKSLTKIKKDKYGLERSTFDESIQNQNNISEELYDLLED